MTGFWDIRKVRPHFFYKLYCFHFVVRCRSYRRAALHLHLTQPALSRAIQSLEFALGCRLLHRKTRATLRLTPEGARVFAWSTELLRILQGLSQDTEPQAQAVHGCTGCASHAASSARHSDLGALFEGLAGYFNSAAQSQHQAINALCQHLKQHSCQSGIKQTGSKPHPYATDINQTWMNR